MCKKIVIRIAIAISVIAIIMVIGWLITDPKISLLNRIFYPEMFATHERTITTDCGDTFVHKYRLWHNLWGHPDFIHEISFQGELVFKEYTESDFNEDEPILCIRNDEEETRYSMFGREFYRLAGSEVFVVKEWSP